MSRANLLIAIIIMAVVCPGIAMARTSLINPTSEGGFEAGTTFLANGWTAVGNNQNQYYVGTAPG